MYAKQFSIVYNWFSVYYLRTLPESSEACLESFALLFVFLSTDTSCSIILPEKILLASNLLS